MGALSLISKPMQDIMRNKGVILFGMMVSPDMEDATEPTALDEELFSVDKAWGWHKDRSNAGVWSWYTAHERQRDRDRKKLQGAARGGMEANEKNVRRKIADFWKHSQKWKDQN